MDEEEEEEEEEYHSRDKDMCATGTTEDIIKVHDKLDLRRIV